MFRNLCLIDYLLTDLQPSFKVIDVCAVKSSENLKTALEQTVCVTEYTDAYPVNTKIDAGHMPLVTIVFEKI